MAEHFDVIVVGAGLAGISAAYHLQQKCPSKSYAILEARQAIGGTWDLFRYPGIRSDSDMYTLGFRFKPWRHEKAIADGATIREYVQETAREHGIDQKIRFGHRVTSASWSTQRARWTIECEHPEQGHVQISCSFLFMCPGYYKYSGGYTPEFAGIEQFQGRVVHPQLWTEDIDYAGKRVVVIGSGATAMTLVPELAKKAEHVVMLQRSPTYVVSAPAADPFANFIRKILPAKLAYGLTRWKNVFLGILFFHLTRRWPALAKKRLLDWVREELPPGYVEQHFTPRYNVWDQRVCLVPDSDLFIALRAGTASVVTDHIDRFAPGGILLKSGQELQADMVVTATGLELEVLGGAEFSIDGRRIELNQTMNYKGCMFSDVPNLAYAFGYTNASWTLKADLTSEYVCRLLNKLDATGATHCVPRRKDPTVEEQPWLDFTSGYVQRALAKFPKQGSKRPFRLYQNYALDLLLMRYGSIEDGALELASTAIEEEPEPAALPSLTNHDA